MRRLWSLFFILTFLFSFVILFSFHLFDEEMRCRRARRRVQETIPCLELHVFLCSDDIRGTWFVSSHGRGDELTFFLHFFLHVSTRRRGGVDG
jgi:hypothetical protein